MIAPKALLPLASLLFGASASPLNAHLYRRQASLNSCLEASSLDYVDSNSADWTDAIVPHNLREPVTPRAIVYAMSNENVQHALLCGVEAGIKVTAKSGGHSYASMGLGGDDGHLVIQLDHWYGVELRDDNTAIINAGTRLGVVALELYNQGKRGISHGTCPSVGVGGHVGHGGFGFSSHTHGLALDAVIGANIVLADGSLVHASKTENEDLFWAISGASSSFGIVVQYEVETFDVSETFTSFKISSTIPTGTKEEAADSLLAFQEVLEQGGLDQKLNMRVELGAIVTVEAVYHGSLEDGKAALKAFEDPLRFDWSSNSTSAVEATWLDTLDQWTNGDPLNITYPFGGHDYSYISSLVTKHIPKESMHSFMAFLYDVGLADGTLPWWLQMDVLGDPNSAVAAVPPNVTSFSHRDKLWMFQFASPLVTGNPDEEGAFALVNAFMDSLKTGMSEGEWGRYANYIDSQLSREDAQEQYWSTNLRRLQSIKAKYDPTEVFYNPQSIEPVA